MEGGGEDLEAFGGEKIMIKIYCRENLKENKLCYFRNTYPILTSEVNTALDNERINILELKSRAMHPCNPPIIMGRITFFFHINPPQPTSQVNAQKHMLDRKWYSHKQTIETRI